MGLLSVLLFMGWFPLICVVTGSVFLKCKENIKIEYSISSIMLYGFVIHVALFEIIAVPCYFFGATFNVLFGLYLIFSFFLIASFIIIWKVHYFCLSDYFKFSRPTLFFILFLGLVLFQIIYSSYMCHTDADDGYYITISNMAINSNKLELDVNTVYDGVTRIKDVKSVFSWEFFIAVISKMFGIHPAILCHSVLPVILVALSYMAFCLVINIFVSNRKERDIALLIVALLNLYGGYSRHSTGCFLLLRMWQGKAIIACILLPVLLHSCMQVYKGDHTWKRWFLNLLIVFCGIAVSVIGVYYLPIAYFVFGIPLIAVLFIKKKYKEFITIIRRLVITMLPVLLFVLYSIIKSKNSLDNGSQMNNYPLGYADVFKETVGDGYIHFLYLISIFIIATIYFIKIKHGTVEKKDKLTLVLLTIPLILFLTFLNPLLYGFISSHVTGAVVYWRLYWIIPVYLTIAIATSRITSLIKSRVMIFVTLVVMCVTIAFSGKFVYSKGLFFTQHENYYKIPQEVISVSDTVKAQGITTCLFSEDLSYFVRQYNSDIIVIKSRNQMDNSVEIGDTGKTFTWLATAIYKDRSLDNPDVEMALDTLGVEAFYISGERIECNNYDISEIEGYGYLYINHLD